MIHALPSVSSWLNLFRKERDLPIVSNEAKLIQTIRSCAPLMKYSSCEKLLRQVFTYLHKEENAGKTGKINRDELGAKRSILVGKNGAPYLLLTRHRIKWDPQIQAGAFKKIKYAINLKTAEIVAVGTIGKFRDDINEDWTLSQAANETKIMKQLNSDRILKVLEGVEGKTNGEERRYYIITEFCDGGDLFDFIKHQRRLSIQEKKRLFLELLEGVKEMHDSNIIHRDLKPENILLKTGKDGRLHLKIADFGFACYKDDPEKDALECATIGWASPEVFKTGHLSDFPRDIWSAAEIGYAIFTGQCLDFQDFDNEKLQKKNLMSLTDAQVRGNFFFNSKIDPVYSKVIQGMLKVDPNERWNIDRAFKELTPKAPQTKVIRRLTSGFDPHKSMSDLTEWNKKNSPPSELLSSEV